MKKAFKATLAVVAGLATIANVAIPSLAQAYAPKRDEYTKAKINEAYNKYLNNPNDPDGWAPNKIVFNSISDSVIGHEFNFVGARECVLRNDGRCEGVAGKNVWKGNDITVEDGKTYIVRLYVHNNNPYGVTDAENPTAEERKNSDAGTAENVRVAFHVPSESAETVTVNGFIRTTSGEYDSYLDYVNFKSNTGNPFHLEYVYGSALLENNGIGKNGGVKLPNEAVNTVNGTPIGYDALDGRVPGCYQFDNFVTIQVKAVFDYDFFVEKEVRLHDSEDKSWHKAVEAKVGDKVDFLLTYRNTSEFVQNNVVLKDILPTNLKYVKGSTFIKNSNYPNGLTIAEDNLVDNGIKIGHYGPNAAAYVRLTAEVVDNSLACGANSLNNWVHAGVGYTNKQDSATVHVMKECVNPEPTPEPTPEEPEKPTKLPNTGPEAIAGGVIATGSIATAAGYYVVSRRQLRK